MFLILYILVLTNQNNICITVIVQTLTQIPSETTIASAATCKYLEQLDRLPNKRLFFFSFSEMYSVFSKKKQINLSVTSLTSCYLEKNHNPLILQTFSDITWPKLSFVTEAVNYNICGRWIFFLYP